MLKLEARNGSRTLLKLGVDLLIFIGFLVAMEPRATGIAVHEWLSLSAMASLIVHLLLSWDWITQVTRRLLDGVNGSVRLNYILNWVLFIDAILIMLSGILISEVAMPALGLSLGGNFGWRSLHDLSANLFVVLLGLHTALHWGWIVNAFKRFVFQPLSRPFAGRDLEREDGSA